MAELFKRLQLSNLLGIIFVFYVQTRFTKFVNETKSLFSAEVLE